MHQTESTALHRVSAQEWVDYKADTWMVTLSVWVGAEIVGSTLLCLYRPFWSAQAVEALTLQAKSSLEAAYEL